MNEPVWTRELTWLVSVGAVAALLLFVVDARVMDFILSNRNQLTRWLAQASQAGKSEWYLVPALLVYLVTATADWRNSGYRVRARLVSWFGQAAFLFGSIAITGIAVNLVKIVIGRARPSMFGELGAYHFDPFVVSKYFSSFPSGHSTTLGTVAAVLMIWFPRQWLPIGLVCLMLSAFRVPAAAHYPSDVVAGFLFGFVLTVVMARFLAARRVGFRPRPGKMLPAATGMRQKRLPAA
ncbi:phosphatase PAP2 family protein [Aminobacter sp. P9b]|uniref:Undecaprenyl-diphosphatase n=1 Tax=Aminobacter niigataensis TaxID=83265 RepID=A0ABR6L1X8_9HYPH|nr:phosphatase PAP2 family protein [Aminobacter niigataensis]MBB4650070.1 undecaprenyl-diphosphatase [Aminobacter niigataensis]CAI2935444.1 PAP2 superfamily protein [Aminobacter niigataensis]